MTDKPMLSVERELLERIFEALEGPERLLGLKKQRIFPEHRRDKWDSEFAQALHDGCLDGREQATAAREVNPEIANKWEGWEEWSGETTGLAAGGAVDVRLRDGRVFIGCKVPFSGGQFPSNAAQFLWWLRKGEVKDDDIVGIRRLTEATAFGHACSLKRYDDHKEVEGQIYVTYVECSPYSPKTDYRKYVMTFPAYGVKHTEDQGVHEKAKALFAIINPGHKWHKCPEDLKERYEAAAKAEQPTPDITLTRLFNSVCALSDFPVVKISQLKMLADELNGVKV